MSCIKGGVIAAFFIACLSLSENINGSLTEPFLLYCDYCIA
jgi:hypothetical protein